MNLFMKVGNPLMRCADFKCTQSKYEIFFMLRIITFASFKKLKTFQL